MQGTPRTMQDAPSYDDVVEEVLQYLGRRRDALVAAGIARDRIALDPGIGFGKGTEHNLQLLSRAYRLHALGCPVLVGHSRKGFIGRVLDDPKADPLPGTIGVALALARQGVQVLRVHDVGPVRQALLLFEAADGYAVRTPARDRPAPPYPPSRR
jgi:dihydropteroate synthase